MWTIIVSNNNNGEKYKISIDANCSIKQIKEAIFDQTSIPIYAQSLKYRNKPLFKDNLTLQDYGALYNQWNVINPCEIQLFYILNSYPPVPEQISKLCSTDMPDDRKYYTELLNEAWSRVSKEFDKVYDDLDRLTTFEKLQLPVLATHDVLPKLEILCYPCQHPRALLFVSKRLLQFCTIKIKCTAEKEITVETELLRQLNVLVYSDYDEIVSNAIQSYNHLMCNTELINRILSQSKKSEQNLCSQYLYKIERDKKVFEYYLRNIEQSMNRKIHDGMDEIIGKYYFCHSKDDTYQLIPRLIHCCKHEYALECIHKITKFGANYVVDDVIDKYQLLLTLRNELEDCIEIVQAQFKLHNQNKSNGNKGNITKSTEWKRMKIIVDILGECTSINKYCLFNYDMMDLVMNAFTLKKCSFGGVIMNMLNDIKDKIPSSKLKYLFNTYPVINAVCQYLKVNSQLERDELKLALRVIEYFLGIEKDGIGVFCIQQIKQFSKPNLFASIITLDDEIPSTLHRINGTYFTD